MKFAILLSAVLMFGAFTQIDAMAQADAPVESDAQWLWGEVSNLDLQNKLILVKYVDYETDKESEIAITVNNSTVYENMKVITDLKQNDPVSIDYIVSAEGKNIARKVSLEKEEPLSPDLQGVDEMVKTKLGGQEAAAAAESMQLEGNKPQFPSD